MWQDAFENGKDDLDEGTIIEVWKDWGHPGWKGMLKKVLIKDCALLVLCLLRNLLEQSLLII